ncbi:hypothetical protein [Holospora curviuscula]|uniref:Uncharacterized protein n=1 Tax=Holospora curviuscula TaxID=1082868 RepID=A0A2S5R786_9PROT|nr:hypothetical protein [Holospora curviuscula]PPE02985.1 hypothetical protein HCUR_01565 [Holospora curviuscula]
MKRALDNVAQALPMSIKSLKSEALSVKNLLPLEKRVKKYISRKTTKDTTPEGIV